MRMNFVVSGVDVVVRNIEARRQRVLQATVNSINSVALDVVRDAKTGAPVNDGRLRSSIASTTATLRTPRSIISVPVAYAAFVEYGTGPLGRQAQASWNDVATEVARGIGYRPGPVGGFPPLDVIGRWLQKHGGSPDDAFVVARAIRRRGTQAQPFFFPAVQRGREAYRARVTAEVGRALR